MENMKNKKSPHNLRTFLAYEEEMEFLFASTRRIVTYIKYKK
jgi:hypothetical protein